MGTQCLVCVVSEDLLRGITRPDNCEGWTVTFCPVKVGLIPASPHYLRAAWPAKALSRYKNSALGTSKTPSKFHTIGLSDLRIQRGARYYEEPQERPGHHVKAPSGKIVRVFRAISE